MFYLTRLGVVDVDVGSCFFLFTWTLRRFFCSSDGKLQDKKNLKMFVGAVLTLFAVLHTVNLYISHIDLQEAFLFSKRFQSDITDIFAWRLMPCTRARCQRRDK